MKVINEKDYIYVCTEGTFHKFESNPVKVNYDKEYLLVERARLIKLDGSFQFFDYIPSEVAVKGWISINLIYLIYCI